MSILDIFRGGVDGFTDLPIVT